MNTKRRLNCYVFCNFIVSFLTLNVLTNPTSKVLVEKTSNNSLNKIYEKENIIEEIVEIPEIEEQIEVQRISKNSSSEQKSYNYVKPSYNSLTGNNLVNYAMQFIGLPYVSAGNSLATGTDCSGFTRLIYQEFGISLGRTVSSQLYSGTYVSRDDLQPGDLVFYSYGNVASHVAIYIGNGLIVHESTPRDGVKISSVDIMRYITARRLITANVGSTAEVQETKSEVVQESKTNNTNEVVTPIEEKVEVKEEVIQEEVIETKPDVSEEKVEPIKEETKEDNNKNKGKKGYMKKDSSNEEPENNQNN